MSEKWTQLDKQVLVHTPYFRFARDRYVLPGDGGEAEYHYIDTLGSAMVVPVLADGRLVLVRQHRYLMGRASLEFPAGGIREGADPRSTAAAELAEEAGLRAGRLERLGRFAPCNGLSNEICHVFLGTALTTVAAAPEPSEELVVVRRSADEVARAIAAGDLWDGMTIAAFRLLEARRAEEPQAS